MIRLSARLFSLSFRDLSDRLDSFEREVIELKSFRKAVENASPEVAEAAKRVVEEQLQDHVNNGRDLENPLTAKEFTDLNQFYAAQKNKTLELENLLYISKPNDLLAHAKTVHREYLVRIAKRARALNFAPYGLSQMPSILELKKYYQWSFHDMRSNPPPKTTEDLMAFDSLVRKVFLRHYNVSDLLCAGMKELSNREQWSSHQERLYVDYPLLEPFFEEFCTERVKLRLLIGNYMYLSTQLLKVDPKTYKTDDPNDYTTPSYFGHEADNFVGQLCKKTSLVSLLKCAVLEAKQQYEDIEIELKVAGDPELTFTGVPYISHDIMDALLDDAIQNNLVRQEQFGTPPSKIEITVAQKKENENYIVRVSDTAGGQPLDSLDTMLTCWSVYRHFENQYETSGNCSTWSKSPIKIPYAYCAAKVFGGDVSYVSIDGYGTDRQVVFPSHGLTGCSI